MTGAEMLTKILPRLTTIPGGAGIAFIDALNTVVDIFFERLHRKRSEIAMVRFDDLDVDEEIVDLPTNFRGLSSAKLSLVNVAGVRTALTEAPYDYNPDLSGDPLYFRLVGVRRMQIIPAPTASYVLDGWYFAHPGTLTLSSTIPWGGLFNSIIQDAVLVLSTAGSTGAVIEGMRGAIGTMLEGQLMDRTVTPRRNKLWM